MGHTMTNGVSRNRRRDLSLSMPPVSRDPIGQLDRLVEALHQVNRALPTMALGRKELIAFGALLVQINGALLTFTDRLDHLARLGGRNRPYRTYPDPKEELLSAAADTALQNCRRGIRATYAAALTFHADLRQCSCTSRS